MDDPLEARAAQNLLADGRQAILDARRDGRPDVALRHPLRNDEDQRLRAVALREPLSDDRRTNGRDDERHQNQPFPVPDDLENFFRRVLLSRQHGYFLRSGTHAVIPTRTVFRSSDCGMPGVVMTAVPRL